MGINVLSLFDGCSCGMAALERAGVKVDRYYASEIDKYAIQVSEKNYPDIIRLGDINKFDKGWWGALGLGEIDLVIGGFPCQPYSVAGKRLGEKDVRGGCLVTKMLEVISYYKPSKIMLENVVGLLSIDGGNYFKYLLKKLNDIGYAVDWVTINSALVSAQNRERVYIIGALKESVAYQVLHLEGKIKRSLYAAP